MGVVLGWRMRGPMSESGAGAEPAVAGVPALPWPEKARAESGLRLIFAGCPPESVVAQVC